MNLLITTLTPEPHRSGSVQALIDILSGGQWDGLRLLYAVNEMDEALRFQRTFAERAGDLSVELMGLPVHSDAEQFDIVEAVRSCVRDESGPAIQVAAVPSLSSVGAALWWVSHEVERLGALWVGAVEGDSLNFSRAELRDDPMVREPRAAYRAKPASAPESPRQVARQLGLLGENSAFQQAVHDAGTLAEHQVPILVVGETGTGKGVMARLIHECSTMRDGPFVAVNCAALPETLVESILFGHAKGAFTGAAKDQAGKFEQANDGTLFLDELGELPPALQPKLLKVLDDGVVERLGAGSANRVNVRVVAATNVNLEAAVERGEFRQDLYYRISYGMVVLPPLRERRDDLELLAAGLLDRINRQLATPKRLSTEAASWLVKQDWPGNVRDLQNVLGRAALLTPHEELGVDDLRRHATRSPSRDQNAAVTPYPGFSLEQHLAGVREELLQKALDLANGNQSLAARLLGISPQAVHKYVKGRGGAGSG